ncbi:hypothetical protein ANCCEY_04890 [Ancylostoma ceylanicum]|uniref:Uncharacterized protein n=1 Tax=Ancylostoma ceylanicum TaxID=53326 RepID=A0A0D6LW16_9BILA|nr:hypothetical protein ANCCEY_04890 [Ancylostoma ceylanicum]
MTSSLALPLGPAGVHGYLTLSGFPIQDYFRDLYPNPLGIAPRRNPGDIGLAALLPCWHSRHHLRFCFTI